MSSTLTRSTALMIACLLSVGFDSSSYSQTMNQQKKVTKVATSPLPLAEQKSERSRWKTLALKLPGNPYLPPKFQTPLKDEEKREEIATFYRLWSIRSRVLSGTAGKDERKFYYMNLSKDVRYRLAVLEALKGSLGDSAADVSRKRRLNRTLKHLGWLADVYLQKQNQVSLLTPPAASSQTRSTCYVSTWGIILCADEDRLASGLMTGYWVDGTRWRTTDFEYARAYDLLHSLNGIWTNLGGGPEAANTLVLCGTGSAFSARTVGDISQPRSKVGFPTLTPSAPEMYGMLAGCDISSGGLGSGGIAGGGIGGRGQSDPFSAMEEAIAKCNELGDPGAGMQSLPSGGGIFGGGNVRLGAGSANPYAPIVVAIGIALVNTYQRASMPTPQEAAALTAELEAKADESIAASEEATAKLLQREADRAQQDATDAAAAASQAATKADEALAEANADPTKENLQAAADAAAAARTLQAEADKAKKTADDAKAAADAAAKEAADAAAEAKKAKEKAAAKKAAAGLTAGGSASFNFEPGTSSTCSSLQGALNKLRMQCSTQTASFCNLLSRRSALCANSTVIYQDPEAGNPCVQAASPVFDVCEKTKQVMSGLETPVEDGPIRCAESLNTDNLYAQAAALRDPCRNPAMMPNPEKSCAHSVASIPDRTAGGSMPKLSTAGNVIDLPDLRVIDGLGLGFFIPQGTGQPTGAGRDR
jgi:hypothetical protein